METGVSTSRLSVWGIGADNVYAVGREGLVIQYNGESWKQLVTDIPGDLRDVWGTDQAIFAVGDDDTTLPREERSPAIYRIDHDGSVRVY
ncbi:MAG: hypothetical protein GY854_03110 [Deltaproteobacteria bacterium]|nr:hypothetical protein [Deltaproteobacteria bacterium]